MRNLGSHPVVVFFLGILTYWAIQHFTGYGTSGAGAHQHPGGLAA